MSKQTVGFIGLGVMGHSMASHIQAAGHPLHIYTRTKSKADDLIANGATWHDTRILAPECDVIITIVGFPVMLKASTSMKSAWSIPPKQVRSLSI